MYLHSVLHFPSCFHIFMYYNLHPHMYNKQADIITSFPTSHTYFHTYTLQMEKTETQRLSDLLKVTKLYINGSTWTEKSPFKCKLSFLLQYITLPSTKKRYHCKNLQRFDCKSIFLQDWEFSHYNLL